MPWIAVKNTVPPPFRKITSKENSYKCVVLIRTVRLSHKTFLCNKGKRNEIFLKEAKLLNKT